MIKSVGERWTCATGIKGCRLAAWRPWHYVAQSSKSKAQRLLSMLSDDFLSTLPASGARSPSVPSTQPGGHLRRVFDPACETTGWVGPDVHPAGRSDGKDLVDREHTIHRGLLLRC